MQSFGAQGEPHRCGSPPGKTIKKIIIDEFILFKKTGLSILSFLKRKKKDLVGGEFYKHALLRILIRHATERIRESCLKGKKRDDQKGNCRGQMEVNRSPPPALYNELLNQVRFFLLLLLLIKAHKI